MSFDKIWSFDKYKDEIALIDQSGDKLTYKELDNLGERIAKKVGHRCLIFVLCENDIGSVIGYTAFLHYGIVPVMLKSNIKEDLLINLLNIYQPSYIWMPQYKTDSIMGDRIYEEYGYSLLKTIYIHEYPLYSNLALLLTTSGSTGSPKFVRQSYDNIKANTKSIVEYLKLNSSERPITTLPMNYTYGLSIINTHLYVGATILLTDKALIQKEFWEFFKEQKATSFGGVPYTYEMLDKLHFYQMNLPSLKTMTQAGGKLTSDLHGKFAKYAEEQGKKFIVMYGQCEATARMGYLPASKSVEKNGAMGIAIPGGKFTLVDMDGNKVETPYTTGELIYEGVNVTLGYAECGNDLIKGDEWNGRLVTGDMAQFDEDGYYYIIGRKKRFLKIFGNRVSLDAMDRLIKGKYDIEVACAGIDDHMYIFLTDGEKADEVREYVSLKTGINPAAFKAVVIDKIPKNDAGKTQYTELSKYYRKQ